MSCSRSTRPARWVACSMAPSARCGRSRRTSARSTRTRTSTSAWSRTAISATTYVTKDFALTADLDARVRGAVGVPRRRRRRRPGGCRCRPRRRRPQDAVARRREEDDLPRRRCAPGEPRRSAALRAQRARCRGARHHDQHDPLWRRAGYRAGVAADRRARRRASSRRSSRTAASSRSRRRTTIEMAELSAHDRLDRGDLRRCGDPRRVRGQDGGAGRGSRGGQGRSRGVLRGQAGQGRWSCGRRRRRRNRDAARSRSSHSTRTSCPRACAASPTTRSRPRSTGGSRSARRPRPSWPSWPPERAEYLKAHEKEAGEGFDVKVKATVGPRAREVTSPRERARDVYRWAGGRAIAAPMQFSELGLIPRIAQAVAAEGYVTPTPIQAQAIPHVLAGTGPPRVRTDRHRQDRGVRAADPAAARADRAAVSGHRARSAAWC